MAGDEKQSHRTWKWVALTAVAMSFVLAIAVIDMAFTGWFFRKIDDRLIGTWQSDADRTIAAIPEDSLIDGQSELRLRSLYGKMRISYSHSAYTTEFEGQTTTSRYQVVGKDKYSVVIQDLDHQASPLANLIEMSEFEVIHFEDADTYWVQPQLGGFRECFKRVK